MRSTNRSTLLGVPRQYVFTALVLSSLLMVGLPFFWNPYDVADEAPYEVGLMVDLTGSAFESGKDVLFGAQLAVDTINREGGIQGRKIQLRIADSRSTSSGVERALHQLESVPSLQAMVAMTKEPPVNLEEFAGRKKIFVFVLDEKLRETDSREKLVLCNCFSRRHAMRAAIRFAEGKHMKRGITLSDQSLQKKASDISGVVESITWPEEIVVAHEMFPDSVRASQLSEKFRQIEPQYTLLDTPPDLAEKIVIWAKKRKIKSEWFILGSSYPLPAIDEPVWRVSEAVPSSPQTAKNLQSFSNEFENLYTRAPHRLSVLAFEAVQHTA